MLRGRNKHSWIWTARRYKTVTEWQFYNWKLLIFEIKKKITGRMQESLKLKTDQQK